MLNAPRTLPRTGALAALLLQGLAAAGCGLVSADFEGDVKITVEAGDPTDATKTYADIVTFDPEENQDYRDNKDRIKSGEVIGIELEFVRLHPDNRATIGFGQADVRKKREGAEDPWLEAVANWEGVQIVEGNKVRLTLPVEKQAALNKMLFEDSGPLEFRLRGEADQGPVAFTVQATIFLRFTAGL
jgi:hypothetical protein